MMVTWSNLPFQAMASGTLALLARASSAAPLERVSARRVCWANRRSAVRMQMRNSFRIGMAGLYNAGSVDGDHARLTSDPVGLLRELQYSIAGPLPSGHGSVGSCEHRGAILSRARKQAVLRILQLPYCP